MEVQIDGCWERGHTLHTDYNKIACYCVVFVIYYFNVIL